MNFNKFVNGLNKAFASFPCKCGGTFNLDRLDSKGFPAVVIYECSDCKRETEQTMDVPTLDELTPEERVEMLKMRDAGTLGDEILKRHGPKGQ